MSEENALNSKQSYNDDAAPPRKKIKVVSAWNKQEKLEDKLNHILSCTVSSDAMEIYRSQILQELRV